MRVGFLTKYFPNTKIIYFPQKKSAKMNLDDEVEGKICLFPHHTFFAQCLVFSDVIFVFRHGGLI